MGILNVVRAESLINGTYTGSGGVHGSAIAKTPEYVTVYNHMRWILIDKGRRYKSYKKVQVFEKWKMGFIKMGSPITAFLWVKNNLPKPTGKGWQLHILKTKKYPNGFFGPGGLAWRHKEDRHDQNALDIIADWPDRKFRQFVKQETRRRKTLNP